MVKALEKAGFELARISGSHHIMKRRDPTRTVSVPVHGSRNLDTGTVKGILRKAGITVGEFITLIL